MPTYTGDEIARKCLREIGILDPTEAGNAELLKDAREVVSDMLDLWRVDNLTIAAVTRSVYNLVSGTQNYTIGSGGTFNQDFPTAIELWSVIPDKNATQPIELPQGRPLTFEQWQAIRIKSQTGPYPRRLYFDDAFSAVGLGTCSFHPIPNVTTVQVVLYQKIAALTALVANTQYALRPGYAQAIITNGAIRLKNGRFARSGQERDGLREDARMSLGKIKRKNMKVNESWPRPEFVIGQGGGRRTFNIYEGG